MTDGRFDSFLARDEVEKHAPELQRDQELLTPAQRAALPPHHLSDQAAKEGKRSGFLRTISDLKGNVTPESKSSPAASGLFLPLLTLSSLVKAQVTDKGTHTHTHTNTCTVASRVWVCVQEKRTPPWPIQNR